MKLDENYKGHLKWKHRAKQHVIAENGETRQDAIRFMRDHIKYFGYENDFTFDELEIEQEGHYTFVFIIRAKFNPDRPFELPEPPKLRMKQP